MFQMLNQNHISNTRTGNNYQLDFPPARTTHYGTYSLRKQKKHEMKSKE